jgi:hypothetical protein
MARFVMTAVRFDSSVCSVVEASAMPDLPAQMARDVKIDDHYLVRVWLGTRDAVIVTTDGPLQAALRRHGVTCELRDEFVGRYMAAQGP